MIKVGILGADENMAGELLRILIHHPEVELVNLHAPKHTGIKVIKRHKGLVGDTDLKFSDKINLDEIDLLFIIAPQYKIPEGTTLPEDLRVIILDEDPVSELGPSLTDRKFVWGVSEMFRKPLVREARISKILPTYLSVALIALYPLALHLLLNDELKLKVELPHLDKFKINPAVAIEFLEKRLNEVQLSFSKIKAFEIEESETMRALKLTAEFPCAIPASEIEKMYDSIYDDHNFTFLVSTPPHPSEVAGTHKCLIHVSKPSEDTVKIEAVADSVLRGGAGDAVHVMNLLFGLFEKTGLNLQAGLAFKE